MHMCAFVRALVRSLLYVQVVLFLAFRVKKLKPWKIGIDMTALFFRGFAPVQGRPTTARGIFLTATCPSFIQIRVDAHEFTSQITKGISKPQCYFCTTIFMDATLQFMTVAF